MAPPSDSILQHVGNTPLVRLRRVAEGAHVPVLAKCEFLNPGGSLKDRIALSIIGDAEAGGLIKPGDTLVEATGGNTGIGLALVCAIKGYRLVCVMPEKMSHDKRQALRVLGCEVIITDDAPPDDPRNFINLAARLADKNGWFPTEQFKHPANVRAHQETTARELIDQTAGEIAAFVSGVGTGGTLTGVGRVLRREISGVRVVLADPLGSKLAGWVNTGEPPESSDDDCYRLEGMGGSTVPDNFDLSVAHEAIQ